MATYSLLRKIEDPSPGNPVLVHAFSGFLDAGSARQIAVEQLLETLPHRKVATFDIDAFFDYRARRPRMVFDTDHFESVDLPSLDVTEFTDAAGTPFLVVHGPEPDLAWQQLVRELVMLIDDFGVRLTVGVNAIPWASPHTRPVGVTAHASDPALISGYRPWVAALQIPGHVGAMLELTLATSGKPAVGFAVHVPHYLVAAEYPRAALAMLDHVSRATGLVLPMTGLDVKAQSADAAIDEQVRESPDSAEAIAMLEAQYDALDGAPGTELIGPVPTGDEIASQVEEFLRGLDGNKTSE